jgi:hypothetical protein
MPRPLAARVIQRHLSDERLAFDLRTDARGLPVGLRLAIAAKLVEGCDV